MRRTQTIRTTKNLNSSAKLYAKTCMRCDRRTVNRIIGTVACNGEVNVGALIILARRTGLGKRWAKRYAERGIERLRRALLGRYISIVPTMGANLSKVVAA